MEVYTLDNLWRRTEVIDKFESLIWTERRSSWGDFEMVVQSTPENRNLLKTGLYLAMNESFRVMILEQVEDTTDDDGASKITLKGRSLESLLESRAARGSLNNTTTEPKWVLTGTPAEIARQMFHEICVEGILDAGDIIPFVTEGSIFPEDTIAEPTDEITYEVEPKSLYLALKELCDAYDLGFRFVRNYDTSQLYFDVYTGNDLTSSQTTLPAVIFSPNLDNLRNTTELSSIANYKNVALVISPVGHEYVYPIGIDPSIAGFERNVLLVHADDITDANPVIASAQMVQRGNEELAKTRRYSAFDGELTPNSNFRPGRDYNVGDLVELRSLTGNANNMQVTEQIYVSDKEGERSYPTLSINQFIMAGTWLSWDYNQVWEDVPTEEEWADQ